MRPMLWGILASTHLSTEPYYKRFHVLLDFMLEELPVQGESWYMEKNSLWKI